MNEGRPHISNESSGGAGVFAELLRLQTEFQARLAEFYTTLERHFEGDRIVHVDGDREAEAVHTDVLKHVDALRALG